MSDAADPTLDFEAAEAAAEDGEALRLELDGYEGPLHLLLALARSQKVDLLKLSIAELADQYLAFVEVARRRQFALAADYLVMAAWLAYLKSRLLLPKVERTPDAEAAAPEMAEALAFRLAKLDAMRRAAERLRALPQVGRDVFLRGAPEPLAAPPRRSQGDLHRLLKVYVGLRERRAGRVYKPELRVEAFPLDAARQRLSAMLPDLSEWTCLEAVAPHPDGESGPSRESCLASTFSAGLEFVREGVIDVRQAQAFADLYFRRRDAADERQEQAA